MRNRIFVYALCLAMLNFASPQAAQAALVGTLQAVEASSTRAQDMAIVNTALAREQVRGQMAAMGVDPSAVDAQQVEQMVERLAERMEHMPAGGDALAVIGIVFVVLIILELVGVIDIFKKA